jgi:hypothetical protein
MKHYLYKVFSDTLGKEDYLDRKLCFSLEDYWFSGLNKENGNQEIHYGIVDKEYYNTKYLSKLDKNYAIQSECLTNSINTFFYFKLLGYEVFIDKADDSKLILKFYVEPASI